MTEDDAIEIVRQVAVDEIALAHHDLETMCDGTDHRRSALRMHIIKAGMLLASLRDQNVKLRPLAGSNAMFGR